MPVRDHFDRITLLLAILGTAISSITLILTQLSQADSNRDVAAALDKMTKLSSAAVEQAKVMRQQAYAALLTAQAARAQADALRNTSDSTRQSVLLSRLMANEARISARDARQFQHQSIELEVPQIFLTELAIERIRPAPISGHFVDLSASIENAGRTPITISRVLLTAVNLRNRRRRPPAPASAESVAAARKAIATVSPEDADLLARANARVDFDYVYSFENAQRFLKPGESFKVHDTRVADSVAGDGDMPSAIKVYVVIVYRDIFGVQQNFCKSMLGFLSENVNLRRVLQPDYTDFAQFYEPEPDNKNCAQFSNSG